MMVEYQVMAGSTAYGLAEAGSDVDRRGWYLAPIEDLIGLNPVSETIQHLKPLDEQYWEIRAFIRHGLKGNPSVLETLWVPQQHISHATPFGQQLRENRQRFLSKRLIKTYGGYAISQMGRAEQALGIKISNDSRQYNVKADVTPEQTAGGWKHMMHLFRLLLAGIHVLRYGEILVDVSDNRSWLLAVKHGQAEIPELLEQYQMLEESFQEWQRKTPLPDVPDEAGLQQLLLDIRKTSIQKWLFPV